MQMQLDLGVLLAELANDGRQDIARLRMRRADRERAAPVPLLFLGEPLDALDLFQNLQGPIDDAFSRWRDLRQSAALAQEDRESELVFELLQLLADSGL